MLTRTSRIRRPIALAFVAGLLTAAIAVPLPVMAGLPVSVFVFEVGGQCISGSGPADIEVAVTLRNAKGKSQGQFKVISDGDGNWGECFWAPIDPGDSVTAKFGSSSRTLVVPPLTLNINRVTNVVKGKGPRKSQVGILVSDCHSEWRACDTVNFRTAQTNKKGAYKTNFSNEYNIRGGDLIEAYWESPNGDIVYLERVTPLMRATLDDNLVEGLRKPESKVSVWLFDKKGKKIAKANDRSDDRGNFVTKWKKKGKPVDLSIGDFVGSNIAGDALFQVIDYMPTFNINSEQITAKCFANAAYRVRVRHQGPDAFEGFQHDGVTSGNGNLSLNTADVDDFDLSSGDQVAIACRNSAGDELEEIFTVP